jgi:hypothetical protein
MFKRKGGRALPLGHKPRGFQRPKPRPSSRARVLNGPTAQQSVVGTQTATTPGVFSSAAGGAGYRTLETPPIARAPVQPFSFGFFVPFALPGVPIERTRAEVPFADRASSSSSLATAPAAPATRTRAPATPQRSTVFPFAL